MPIPISPEALALLSAEELRRLTLWKWAYILEAEHGHEPAVARRLAFLWMLRADGRLNNHEDEG